MVGRSVPLQVLIFSSLPFIGCLSGGFVEARRAGRLSCGGVVRVAGSAGREEGVVVGQERAVGSGNGDE
jgi:hypothetical protein